MSEKIFHEFRLVTPFNVDAAMRAWKEGHDYSASMAMRAVSHTLKEIIRRADAADPFYCFCLDCDHKFSREYKPMAFGVVMPSFPQQGDNTVIAHGICDECFTRHDLKDQILRTLREMFPHGQFREVERMQ